MTDLSYTGKTARVVTPIPAGGEGEVMIDLPRGGTQVFAARAYDGEETARAGEQVWIEEMSGRTAYVTKR